MKVYRRLSGQLVICGRCVDRFAYLTGNREPFILSCKERCEIADKIVAFGRERTNDSIPDFFRILLE